MKSRAPEPPPEQPPGVLGRLRRSLTARVVLATVLATVTSALVAGIAVSRLAVHAALGAALPATAAGWVDACAADPPAFGVDQPTVTARAFGADGAGPAGTLDPILAAQLAIGVDPAFRTHLRTDPGAALAWTTGRTDGCAVLHVRWYVDPTRRTVGLVGATGLAALGMVGATLLALWLAVRPTVRRVQEIAWAARRVGSDDWRPLAGGADDLGQVADRLDEAHRRIGRDRAAAEGRRRDLERHLSDVAHDLRTPLAALQLRLERLQPTDADRATLADALADVVYLSQLTANLNLAAQLREGTLAGRVDLGAVAERVAARFRLLGERRGVEVVGARPDDPVWVDAHPVHAEQLAANLVHNAVVHNGPGGHVALVVEPTDGGFELVVADDGPGVAPEDLPALTQRAHRLDRARTREPTGRGLGLSIVAEVCRQQGWTLEFEDNAPGLRVRVTGPRTPA